MKIKELHIYGYGKFENKVIKNIHSLQVFFGENESGKSTIMSFIHSILFGFPMKHQNELRYEPIRHGKYGGKIILEHEKYGIVQVERVKGKAVGDVTVILQDGTTGKEELLKEMFHQQMDKSYYQSIFSFTVHGLQDVHKVKQEDLGKYLFSTSAIGSNRILDAEKTLQKEMDGLYKKSGVKPLINEKLYELKELDQQLIEAKKNIHQYEKLLERAEEKQDELKRVRISLHDALEEKNRMLEWNRNFSLIEEWNQAIAEQEQLKDIYIPDHVLEQFDEIIVKLSEGRNKSAELMNKLDQLKEEINNIQVNEFFIQQESTILSVVEKGPLFEQLSVEMKQLEFQKQELDDEMSRLKNRLGINLTDEQIDLLNVSFTMKGNIQQLENKRILLQNQKARLDQQFSAAKMELDQLEQRIETLHEQLLPEEKRKKLEQSVSSNDKILLEQQLALLNEQLPLLEKGNDKQPFIFRWLITIFIILCFSIGSALYNQWQLAILVFIIGIVFAGWQWFRKDSSSEPYIELLKLKRNEVIEKLERISRDEDLQSVTQLLQKDSLIHKELEVATLQIEQANRKYDQFIDQYEEWETNFKENQRKLNQIREMLLLPKSIHDEYIHEAFSIFAELKDRLMKKRDVTKRLLHIDQQIKEFEQSIEQLAHKLNRPFTTMASFLYEIKKELNVQLRNFYQVEEKNKKLIELQEEYQLILTDLQFYEEQIQALMVKAKVSSMEEWNEKKTLVKRKKELIYKVERLTEQIPPYLFEYIQKEFRSSPFSKEEIYELEISINTHQSAVEKLEKEIAELKHQIEMIENGGTYTDLLHRFHEKRYEINELAKQWAKYAVAKSVLTRSILRYKNEKLPKVLKKASEFFSQLTNGNYLEILVDESNDELVVKRKDETVFRCYELSQATSEQVYVALRFALATQMESGIKYPIMIDDGFVHFDENRLKNMISILKEISKDFQILFFTCHNRLLSIFDQSSIFHLNDHQILFSNQ